jgi:protease I
MSRCQCDSLEMRFERFDNDKYRPARSVEFAGSGEKIVAANQAVPAFGSSKIIFLRKSPAMEADRPLAGKRCLMFVDDIYEDLELWYPRLRLIEAGAEVTVAGPKAGQKYAGKHSYPCVSDAAIAEVHAADFDGLVIPGGFMPDKLRRDPKVLQLVRDFVTAGKLVAAICHAGWIPISAGVYRGVKVTGSPGIKDDLVNAGAVWEDAAVVVDRHFVSSRKPDDLPNFCRGILQVLSAR